jgi:uncharacterized protein DUF6265
MRNLLVRALCACGWVLAVVAALPAQPGSGAAAVSRIKAADFAWMAGRWRGDLKTATAEQICSRPDKGEMLCLFRVHDGKEYVMFELYTLRETPDGIELRSLHFNPTLEDKTQQTPLVMKLARYSETEVVFEGAPGGELKTSTLTRHGKDAMDGRIEFVGQATPHIEVRWTRVPY